MCTWVRMTGMFAKDAGLQTLPTPTNENLEGQVQESAFHDSQGIVIKVENSWHLIPYKVTLGKLPLGIAFS